LGDFVHRDNHPLDSFDSICIHCFRTVANHHLESELAAHEEKQVCAEEEWISS